MKRRLAWCAIVCLLFCIPAFAAGEYRTVEVESLQVTIDTEWSSLAAPGYWPVRLDITNLGDDRVIEIFGQGNRWWNTGDSGAAEIRRTLRLKRGDRLRLTISVPVYGDNDSTMFQIRERGRTLEAFTYAGIQSNKSPDEAPVLIVADPASPLGKTAAGWLRLVPFSGGYRVSGPSGVVGGTTGNLDFILDPARLPSEWLGFTSLRAVVIGPAEWSKLTAAQKEALLIWTACGGDFIVLDGDLNTLFPDKQSRPASIVASNADQVGYYFGSIRFMSSSDMASSSIPGKMASGGGKIYESVPGYHFVSLDDALSKTRASEDPGRALPANRASDWLGFSEHGFRISIPGVEGVPVRSYMAILVVFSVLIGPVNYLWLWRKKREVLLVLTAPLISIGFIAVLAGYALLGEGIGTSGRAESFTFLDQTAKHAATRATVSLYAAGMAPWNGLRFPREMAIFPVGVDGRGSREHESLDLTENQQFSSGIARARAPSNFEEISFRPARERMNFSQSGGNMTVVNGLGVTVNQLFYRTGGEVYTLGGPLRVGGQATMHAGGKVDPGAIPAKFARIAERQAEGTYLAYLDHSPFLDTGTPNVEERGSFHLVLGYAGVGQ